MNNIVEPSSFRDSCGFVFYHNGEIYRQVNQEYDENYNQLMNSGLYHALIDDNLLIPHLETDIPAPKPDVSYKIIRPEPIPFISYPYEWCFSQLKDAALTTLTIQKNALKFGMTLKDCSVYNVQFKQGKPMFIDTLSFEKYREGTPWVAYKQFCQHFLAPLALMSYKDIRLNQFSMVYLDGIPLDLTSSLLPFRSWFRYSLFSHIHLHAKLQKKYSEKPKIISKNKTVSRDVLFWIINNLESTVRNFKWTPRNTAWGDYYTTVQYSPEAFSHKKQLVSEFLGTINPTTVWDLGANTGVFSRIASDKGIRTISFDIDPAAVETNYLTCKRLGETHILPLLMDLTNPSPGVGWSHKERKSLLDRGPADAVFALALIHHLAISNNLPFTKIADFLTLVGNFLIIEFIPKSDPQCKILLSNRDDIFDDYNQQLFEELLQEYYNIINRVKIRNSERILYLMQRKNAV